MGCDLPQERKANIATIQPAETKTAIIYRRIGSTTYKVRVHFSETAVMYRRIGSTTYKVRIHFSDTAEDTLHDKILHLVQNEAMRNGSVCAIMEIPQTSQPLEGSSL